MKMLRVAFCVLGMLLAIQCASSATDRELVVTVDDLPVGSLSPTRGDAATALDITSKLLAILRQNQIPAVGFVNEQKVYKLGEVDQRIKCLQMWLDSGFELGNHTFSHMSFHKVGLKKFEDDVVQGEPVISLLLAQHKMKLQYFRHPFLETGTDLQDRRELEAFLASRGYTIAPVTVDPFDWMFEGVYADAKRRGDTALQQQVVEAYLAYVEKAFAFSEQLSKDLVGYEIRQVLLLHASTLNADHLNEVVEKIRARGYRFVTLDTALSDPAYSLPDTYIGDEGNTWLQHWAVTRGQPRMPVRPPLPDFIERRYEALSPSP
jgi:peptidoglycan-N-acetylglucosamine deacetylase